MAVTLLGRFLRELRISRQELVEQMADNIGITVHQLLKIQEGKLKLSNEQYINIIKKYSLNEQQVRQLRCLFLHQ